MTETISLAENFHRRFGLTPIILQRVCLVGAGNPHNRLLRATPDDNKDFFVRLFNQAFGSA